MAGAPEVPPSGFGGPATSGRAAARAEKRAGGDQVIPRPPVWAPGELPPWDEVACGPVELEPLAARIAARGPGRPPVLELDDARHSAVLVALAEGPDGAEVVLTRRARHLSTHKGEVSFPGGRMEPGESPPETALREAEEEVGLASGLATVVGELDHLSTVVSRSLIVPVVATLHSRPALRRASAEVDRILHVSLADLLRPGTYHEERWGTPPLERAVSFFDLDDETVWGATARMLVQLLALATGTEDGQS